MFPQRKERFYRFDGFAVDATKRLLLRDNRPVSINPKAFELLVALVENHGQVMTKEKLLERVWPNQFIEEGNLTVHISAVRKALGERKHEHRYVVTIPGQGYQFVADITNGEMGEELVIEQHTLSRITVEEEEDTDDQTLKEATIAQAIEIPSRTVNGNGHAAEPQLTIHPSIAVQTAAASTGRSRRINAAITAAVILGLLVASIFAYRLYNQRQNQLTAAGPHRNAQGMTSRQLTANGNVSGALLSPDGKYFVYVVLQGGKESL